MATMDKLHTYHIEVRGRIDEPDLNATSPIQMAVAVTDADSMRLTVYTDQSGLIGLIRHLHGCKLAILSLTCKRRTKGEQDVKHNDRSNHRIP